MLYSKYIITKQLLPNSKTQTKRFTTKGDYVIKFNKIFQKSKKGGTFKNLSAQYINEKCDKGLRNQKSLKRSHYFETQ